MKFKFAYVALSVIVALFMIIGAPGIAFAQGVQTEEPPPTPPTQETPPTFVPTEITPTTPPTEPSPPPTEEPPQTPEPPPTQTPTEPTPPAPMLCKISRTTTIYYAPGSSYVMGSLRAPAVFQVLSNEGGWKKITRDYGGGVTVTAYVLASTCIQTTSEKKR